MTRRELAMDAASLVREQKRQLAAKAEARRRTAPKRAASSATKERGEQAASQFYEAAKAKAADRSRCPAWPEKGPRCEVVAVVNGQEVRCPCDGVDPDHVLGGAMRKECERLGAEGLMVMCRFHHDSKHANTPSRAVWLDLAKTFALRHGYRRLLSLVARARAKYEAKHPESRGALSPRSRT